MNNAPIIISFGIMEFLAIMFLILSVTLISRRDYYRKIIRNLQEDNPIIFIAATLSLIIGIILVGMHNIIELKMRVFVTLFCWIILIKSLFWLMLPEKMLTLTKKIAEGRWFYILSIFFAVLGCWLLFRSSELFILKVN